MLPLEGIEELLEGARQSGEEGQESAPLWGEQDELLLLQEAPDRLHYHGDREGSEEDLEVSITLKLTRHGTIIQCTAMEIK